jgi:hypothetical protein
MMSALSMYFASLLDSVKSLEGQNAMCRRGRSARLGHVLSRSKSHAQVQLLQRRLLELIRREHPDAMYPAALCALADLYEVRWHCLSEPPCSTSYLQACHCHPDCDSPCRYMHANKGTWSSHEASCCILKHAPAHHLC